MPHLLNTLHTKNNLRGSQQTKTQEWKTKLRKKHSNPSKCKSRESSMMGKQRRLEAAKWLLATPQCCDSVLESQADSYCCCHQEGERVQMSRLMAILGRKRRSQKQEPQPRIGTGAAISVFYILQAQSEFSLSP